MIACLLLVQLLSVFYVLAEDRNDLLPPGETRRLYYGEHARIEDYPYFAGLWNCGAVILSDVWIATAAHCVETPSLRGPQKVYVGGNTINNSEALSYSTFVVHPGFIHNHVEHITFNDIALLKLNTPLRFSKTIQPAKLPTTNLVPRNVVIVGRGQEESGQMSVELKKVDHVVLSPQECLSMMSPSNVVLALKYRSEWDKMLCSMRLQDLPSVCRGDSGSPVLNGNTLVGLHTTGRADCDQGRLASHTNVLSFVPWIRSQTGL